MRDHLLPGWHLPPGTWPFSIENLMQAALQPAVVPTDAGAQGAVSFTKPPSGGLFGTFAGRNAPWDSGTSGPPSAAMPSASGGLLGSLAPPDDGWRSGAPHWLQTALAAGLDLGSPLPWSDPPPPAPAPFASAPPTLPNLPVPPLADLDPSGPYWLRTVMPPDPSGGDLPLSTPSANAPADAPLQQARTSIWDSATLPIPPALPPVFLTAPPNGSWNGGAPSLWDILAGSNAGLPAPPAASDLPSGAARRIPAAPPTPAALEDRNQFYDAMTTALAPPRGAAAVASPAEPLGRSQTWPAVPPRFAADVPWTRDGIETQGGPRVMSDVTPDNDWTPGARYASKAPRRGSGPLEHGQAIRLIGARTRAESAIARVRELDPGWRPRPSAYEGVEGLIRAHESVAEQAHRRLRELARLHFSPIIPVESRLPGQRWSDTARDIARWLVKNQGHVAEGASWLFELEPSIEAYIDPPKTLEELRHAVSNPKPGYDIHHIVEKKPAKDDHFPDSMIHGPDNLVRIPRFKHWEINSWYMTKNRAYKGRPPRDYVHGKDWATRRAVGLDALIENGVLKP